MRILAILQGHYGQRMVDNIRKRAPAGWGVETFEPPKLLPTIIDDPSEFLPPTLPQADLVLSLAESPRAAQLIPAIAWLSGAKAVLAPIDNSAWMPTGLKSQLRRELEEMGVESAFPKPFCTLTEETAGYRRAAEPYRSETIAEFARHFGRPKLNITVDDQQGAIQQVEVLRGSPCGATHYAAERLAGTPVEEAVPKAGLISHHYPCLASMEREQIDDRLFETLMHVSGYVINEEVAERLKPYRKAHYFTPEGVGEAIREPGTQAPS
jgi:hypothetical protein